MGWWWLCQWVGLSSERIDGNPQVVFILIVVRCNIIVCLIKCEDIVVAIGVFAVADVVVSQIAL